MEQGPHKCSVFCFQGSRATFSWAFSQTDRSLFVIKILCIVSYELSVQVSVEIKVGKMSTAPAFSESDQGRTVKIKDGKVKLDGIGHFVQWDKEMHADGSVEIASVESQLHKGKVKLQDNTAFQNPSVDPKFNAVKQRFEEFDKLTNNYQTPGWSEFYGNALCYIIEFN